MSLPFAKAPAFGEICRTVEEQEAVASDFQTGALARQTHRYSWQDHPVHEAVTSDSTSAEPA